MMLVGNKTDLAATRMVSTEQGTIYARERGISFLEASALTASNVEASFLQASSQTDVISGVHGYRRIDCVSQILSEIYHKKANKEAKESGNKVVQCVIGCITCIAMWYVGI